MNTFRIDCKVEANHSPWFVGFFTGDSRAAAKERAIFYLESQGYSTCISNLIATVRN